MKDTSSPEDKLLKLIRKPKKQPSVPLPAPEVIAAKLKPNPAHINKSIIRQIFFNPYRVIFLLFIASCAYLVVSVAYRLVGLKNIKLPKPSEKQTRQQLVKPKPIEEYLKSVSGRQVFFAGQTSQGSLSVNAANTDLMKDFSLVGIISGQPPQAVIEDKKAQKTFYVTKGQFVGQLQIEDIQEGKIIVNYDGQKYELNI